MLSCSLILKKLGPSAQIKVTHGSLKVPTQNSRNKAKHNSGNLPVGWNLSDLFTSIPNDGEDLKLVAKMTIIEKLFISVRVCKISLCNVTFRTYTGMLERFMGSS